VPLRVLLDTSAIRGILYADAEYRDFDSFAPKEAGISVCLANNAVPELALALFEGRIAWNRWSARVGVVTALLDPESPLFPSDDESQSLFFAPPRRTSISRREHGIAIWRFLSQARALSDLEAGPTFEGSDGVQYTIASSEDLATRLSEEHRDGWRGMIREMKQALAGYQPMQDHVAELEFHAFFGGRPDEATLRRQNDAYIRSRSRFIALALGGGVPYNADAQKRRGDSFDLEMLQALSLPVLICTGDERLRSHVVMSGSIQATQLVSPTELLDEARRGILHARLPCSD
jgi:hypothetical protein